MSNKTVTVKNPFFSIRDNRDYAANEEFTGTDDEIADLKSAGVLQSYRGADVGNTTGAIPGGAGGNSPYTSDGARNEEALRAAKAAGEKTPKQLAAEAKQQQADKAAADKQAADDAKAKEKAAKAAGNQGAKPAAATATKAAAAGAEGKASTQGK